MSDENKKLPSPPVTDVSARRRWITSLFSGGRSSTKGSAPIVRFESNDPYQRRLEQDGPSNLLDDKKDWRVRISLAPGLKESLYNQLSDSAEIDLIRATDGVLFPYVPQMTVTHNARYAEQSLTHSNYKGYFYEGSDVAPIQLSGTFTAQNEKEAAYVQSVIYFMRTCTKMRFGQSDPNAGTPPPLVRLSGYGDFYMPAVTCVITSFTHTMPDDCDYVPFKLGNRQGRMPAVSTISVTLQPILSRKRQAQDFSLDSFSAGKYLGTRDSDQGGLL
jgi:hypothetical protein